MLYLGIDQHKSQLTVNLRDEHGNVIDKRQVSTKHSDIDDYFDKLAKQAARHRGFMAMVEVCGFNHWLIEELKCRHCRKIVVVQPEDSAVSKTDQRDANTLCELLWNNRKHLQNGNRPNGIRRIYPAEPADQEIRQLANHRQSLVYQRLSGTSCDGIKNINFDTNRPGRIML